MHDSLYFLIPKEVAEDSEKPINQGEVFQIRKDKSGALIYIRREAQ